MTLVEFVTVTKAGVEQFVLPIEDIAFLGVTKNGCCVQKRDGCTFDAVNAYADVKSTLSALGVTIVAVPVK